MEQFQMDLAGRTLTIETGELAKQAGGAVMVGYGDTRVLVTATGSKEAKDIDFFPLTVDYEEKMYAVGRLPGGFIKREARPPESAILNSRLIDRPIRPLFDKGVRNEVHVVATVMSVDQDCDPAVCGMIGASAALSISDVPWNGPIAGVRMGRINGEFVVNPTKEQLEATDLNIVVAGTKDAILMVEGGAQEVPEETILEVIMAAHEEIKKIVAFQEDMKAKVGKEKRVFESKDVPAEIADAVRAYGHDKLDAAVRCADKQQRDAQESEVRADVLAHFEEIYPDNLADVNKAFDAMIKEIVRHMITVEKIRPDGRKLDEVRPISCRTGVLPRTHGSGLFTRGQTQVLNVATVAPLSETQTIDGIGIETEKRYIHHYNFPSFSVGETRSSRGPGRREIGHGALAERALVPVIPSEEEFPYALRLVSEVLESNGSSSMASVCGSTLSLMDAGVPIKAPVAGIAMGLVKEEDKFVVLSDILGDEDHLGDMDFKTTGTRDGLTATQMDIKCDGLSFEILEQALMQAKAGREHILNCMLETISEPRAELKPQVPRIVQLEIPKEFIGAVIGPGGKIIQQMQEETGATITIEETDGVGKVQVSAPNKDSIDAALGKIKAIVAVPEIGEVYEGVVRSIMPYGCFVEILPGKDGLLHISEIDWKRLETVEEAGIKEGDKIKVKLLEIDPKTGKYKLSRRVLLEKPEGYVEPQRRPRGDRRPRRDGERRFDDRRPRRENNEFENND